MMINSKFRAPVERAKSEPKKKNFDFYKTIGNLWDSRYLTCSKISKFYHDNEKKFMEGSKSPQNLAMLESTEKAQKYIEKAKKNIRDAQFLLRRRKGERVHVKYN